jgi:CheY-like chemotaxis protein
VDDSSTIAKMVCRQLQQRGFRVDVACDGEEGLRLLKLKHRDYTFVLSDLEMPHKTGPQMVAEFRAWEGRILARERDRSGRPPPDLFICSMSASGGKQDDLRQEEPPSHNAFIEKPVTMAKLNYVIDMVDNAPQWSTSW